MPVSIADKNADFNLNPLGQSLATTGSPTDFFAEVEFRIDQLAHAHKHNGDFNYYELFFGPDWEAQKEALGTGRELNLALAEKFSKTTLAIRDYMDVYDRDAFKDDLAVEIGQISENSPAYYLKYVEELEFLVSKAYETLTHDHLRTEYDQNLGRITEFWNAAPQEVQTLPLSHFHLRDDRSLIGTEGESALKNWGNLKKASPLISDVAHELIEGIGFCKEANIHAQHKLGEFQKCRHVVIPGQEIPVDADLVYECIIDACREFASGKWNHHFNIPSLQGGAGTSINMTANEIIANRANMILYSKLSMDHLYDPSDLYNPAVHLIHPNDHVNFPNSTNDIIPTALNLMTVMKGERVLDGFRHLRDQMAKLAEQESFYTTVKQGRTHLQSAVPMTYAQELEGNVAVLNKAIRFLESATNELCASTLGANAAGTGINSVEGYNVAAADELNTILQGKGIRAFTAVPAQHLPATTWSQLELLQYHSTLKNALNVVSKMANDIRFYTSADTSEVVLSPKQAGSSIMPGKVNPTMAEIMNQTYQVIFGNDIAVTEAAADAQLQLQVFGPVTIHAMSNSQNLAEEGLRLFADECLEGLSLNMANIRRNLGNGPSLATALNPILGYKATAAIVTEMRESQRSIWEVVEDDTFMSKLRAQYEFLPDDISKARAALNPEALLQHTHPRKRDE